MTPANEAKPLITFWGTHGSTPTPGRITEKYGGNTPCVNVLYQDIHIIFNAGTGIRNLGIELMDKSNNLGNQLSLYLFLSHTYWDHFKVSLSFSQPISKILS